MRMCIECRDWLFVIVPFTPLGGGADEVGGDWAECDTDAVGEVCHEGPQHHRGGQSGGGHTALYDSGVREQIHD